MNRANLGSVERSTYQEQSSDGLAEILAGVGIALLGITFLTEMVPLTGLVPIVLMPLWKPLRERIVEPRIGAVTFREARRSQLSSGMTAMLYLGIGTFALGLIWYLLVNSSTGADRNLAEWLVPGLPVALLGLGVIVLGRVLELSRLYGIGALLIAIAAVTIAARAHPGWSLIAAGIGVAAVGAVMMTRFLQANPRQER